MFNEEKVKLKKKNNMNSKNQKLKETGRRKHLKINGTRM